MTKEIEPKLKLISEYLKLQEKEKFVIPEYQREYSWTISQCDKLWQDIEAFINSGAEDPYFFGTVIVDCNDSKKEYNLIDGQQRTTTFILLLKALLTRLNDALNNFQKTEDSEVLEEGLKEHRNKIMDILYKADVKKRDLIRKNWEVVKKGVHLLENHSINELYRDDLNKILYAKSFVDAERNVHKTPKKQKDNKYTNFFRNFKFFYGKLAPESYLESKLCNFAEILLGKCQIIEIRSWQIEQAITMFNSLNSTGMPLSDADIISAKLYSNAGKKKNNFIEMWENINELADDLESRNIVDISAVLQQYMYIRRASDKVYMNKGKADVTTPGLRKYYTEIKKDLLKNPMDLCDNLMKVAALWNTVKNFPIVKLLLKFNENAKLYLISYLNRFPAKKVKAKDGSIEFVLNVKEAQIIDITECLIRLFALLELDDYGYSSSLFKTFLFGENVKLVDTKIKENVIITDFNKHIEVNWTQDDVREYLNDYRKNTLVFLNEYLYAKANGKCFDFTDSVNVEHIMPASGHNIDAIRKDAKIKTIEEFDEIVNSIGNKILLEENINKSIGKEWFETKKQTSIKDKSGYKNSMFAIAQDLVKYPKKKWEKKDIEEATDKAIERIVKFIFNEN